jgi:ubiquinone/menaquinone biosynthesis C-methylase UbiE
LLAAAADRGVWVVSQTGASLIGIDASRVALTHACNRVKHLGRPQAVFFVGVFDRLPIQTASADAVMSVDALQYAADKSAALLEIGRILRPGGRLSFSAFEVDVTGSADSPYWGAIPSTIFVRSSPALDSLRMCTKKPNDGAIASRPRTKPSCETSRR